MKALRQTWLGLALLSLCAVGGISAGQSYPQTSSAPAPASDSSTFLMHAAHKKAKLDCDGCHVAVNDNSVVLKRPGHDECTSCHQEDFDTPKQSMCAPCHSTFPPKDGTDLIAYPTFKKKRAMLIEFSH